MMMSVLIRRWYMSRSHIGKYSLCPPMSRTTPESLAGCWGDTVVDPVSTSAIVVAHGFWRFFDAAGKYVSHNVGVYGFSETGKSTLDRQLMTEGKVRPLGEHDRTKRGEKHYAALEDIVWNFIQQTDVLNDYENFTPFPNPDP